MKKKIRNLIVNKRQTNMTEYLRKYTSEKETLEKEINMVRYIKKIVGNYILTGLKD